MGGEIPSIKTLTHSIRMATILPVDCFSTSIFLLAYEET